MRPIHIIHSSSRYDRSVSSLEKATARYASLADIIFYTEVSGNDRARALITPGFTRLVGNEGGFDDCGIIFKRSRFELLHTESFHMGGGRYAQIGVLKDKLNGKRLVVSSAHLPAHLEADMVAGRRTPRVILWTRNAITLRMKVNRLKRRFKCHAAIISADWNLDFKLQRVRAIFHTMFPAWTNTWVRKFPIAGTHGQRIIDWIVFKGQLKIYKRARLMVDDDSSDHRPLIVALVWA